MLIDDPNTIWYHQGTVSQKIIKFHSKSFLETSGYKNRFTKNFAHDSTAQLSGHVQNFVVIMHAKHLKSLHALIFINFVFWNRNPCKTVFCLLINSLMLRYSPASSDVALNKPRSRTGFSSSTDIVWSSEGFVTMIFFSPLRRLSDSDCKGSMALSVSQLSLRRESVREFWRARESPRPSSGEAFSLLSDRS